ncbi:MAG TPA: hypothetical protein VIX91_02730 [Candidatus Acidoferrum sp.]
MLELLEILGVLLKLFAFGVSAVTSGVVVYVLLQLWFDKSKFQNVPKHRSTSISEFEFVNRLREDSDIVLIDLTTKQARP